MGESMESYPGPAAERAMKLQEVLLRRLSGGKRPSLRRANDLLTKPSAFAPCFFVKPLCRKLSFKLNRRNGLATLWICR